MSDDVRRESQRLTHDVECLSGCKKFAVDRLHFYWEARLVLVRWDDERGKMIIDCLPCEMQFCFVCKKDRDDDSLLRFHTKNQFYCLYYASWKCPLWTILLGTRFYNNAAKSFGRDSVLCRRLGVWKQRWGHNESEKPWKIRTSRLCNFFWKKLLRAESSTESYASYGVEGSRIATSCSMVSSARFESFCLLKLRKGRLFLSIKWLSVICHTVVPCGMVISSFCFSWRMRL